MRDNSLSFSPRNPQLHLFFQRLGDGQARPDTASSRRRAPLSRCRLSVPAVCRHGKLPGARRVRPMARVCHEG